LRETADYWNSCIERWCYVKDTPAAREVGVPGHYVRIAPPEESTAASAQQGFVPRKHRSPEQAQGPAANTVSTDALALVRFGLRAADDTRIRDTLKVIDHLLKIEMPSGPAWHRYNGDQYGENADGSPYDGSGIGRVWPLLTGERGHYELQAGNTAEARRLLQAMEGLATETGLFPEQTWDQPDIPEMELYFSRPSDSATPLGWAHAEYLKLARSLADGKVFDLPERTRQRYLAGKKPPERVIWKFNNKLKTMPSGIALRVEVDAPARIRWSMDGWRTAQDSATSDTTLGVYFCDLDTARLAVGSVIAFTFFWQASQTWEERNFEVTVEAEDVWW
jgi:glucoamylase